MDTRELARRLATQSARVREGDLVVVSGATRGLRLLEDVAVEVRRVGADSLVTMGSDRMDRLMFDEVPAKYDSQVPTLQLELAGLINAHIGIGTSERRSAFEGVPPERIAARYKAFEPVQRLTLRRGVRQVFLGNELYPNRDIAERFGLTQERLARTF